MPVATGGASAPPTLTVAVLTLNEAHRIEACLQSAAFADQLLVVDSGSTDGTVALAQRKYLCPWVGFSWCRTLPSTSPMEVLSGSSTKARGLRLLI